nr:Chain C, Tax Peptide V7R [synthetic construct]
LLFGYPRYV